VSNRITLGIIPARGGSKRLPRKNLRDLGGKALVQHSIETALKCESVDRWVVSSDNEEVLALAGEVKDTLPLKRPGEISEDTSTALEYVVHAIGEIEKCSGCEVSRVVILQPSSPLTLPGDVDSCVALMNKKGFESVVSVVQVPHDIHPHKFKTMRAEQLEPFFVEEGGRTAAHDLPAVYVRNCSVYVTEGAVIDRKRIIGDPCGGYLMPRERSVDINDSVDFALAQVLYLNSVS
jgi:CMP-N,N'-diacetyllegionaminic acid synthase